jgi:hypothetical protein
VVIPNILWYQDHFANPSTSQNDYDTSTARDMPSPVAIRTTISPTCQNALSHSIVAQFASHLHGSCESAAIHSNPCESSTPRNTSESSSQMPTLRVFATFVSIPIDSTTQAFETTAQTETSNQNL